MKLYLNLFCSSSIQIYNVYIDDEIDDDDYEGGYKNPILRIIKCSLYFNINLAFGFHILVS